MDEPSNTRGRTFEEQVQALLTDLASNHPSRVTVTAQPEVVLQNEETVRPDFHLVIELPHERSHYFIECQSRATYSKSILHKIQHVRAKQPIKTFVFVHSAGVPPELERAMNAEGVMQYALPEFAEFVSAIDKSLAATQDIPRNEGIRDRAMLSEVRERPAVGPPHELQFPSLYLRDFDPPTDSQRAHQAAPAVQSKKWWQFWR